jgi:hypothetical protein
MTNPKPMGITSTPFISYRDIDVRETDLVEDAWGIDSCFSDVIRFLHRYKPVPEERLISSLIERISDAG